MSSTSWLHDALKLQEGQSPFPWQERLLEYFCQGTRIRSLDIPTGLGKTAVMAIWLVARARGAKLPRRLVYVVDRRAVVDQATAVAEDLRRFVDDKAQIKQGLGLTGLLPISTLRGQYVDNREWLADPGSPAIIVGTVDMIGSRLLFEGYGVSRKMRPYHAGLMGADTLVVLDESHLVPPFEELLHSIQHGSSTFGPRDPADVERIPSFALMSLSATGRTTSEESMGLTDDDLNHAEVAKRLDAMKRISFERLEDEGELVDTLAEQAWMLAEQAGHPVRVLVYCHRPQDAEKVQTALQKKAGDAELATELLTGGRRVHEREQAARWLEQYGFIGGASEPLERSAFVIATSAGEVGIDMDANHMVCDLVAWERMVQRLGRVNRRGHGDAQVIVVVNPEPVPGKKVEEALQKPDDERTTAEANAIARYHEELARTEDLVEPIRLLPKTEQGIDASPGAIYRLQLQSREDKEVGAVLKDATTDAPLRPALSRALVDAWSMTSLKEHTGRPRIQPWLRGWVDDEPQTRISWRHFLPVNKDGTPLKKDAISTFFEAAPPHLSEVLEVETSQVVAWLVSRAKNVLKSIAKQNEPGDALHKDSVVAIVLDPAGDYGLHYQVEQLDVKGNDRKDIEAKLRGATLVIDARMAGLSDAGRLDAKEGTPPITADDLSQATDWQEQVGFRVRIVDVEPDSTESRSVKQRHGITLPRDISPEGEPKAFIAVESLGADAADEESRSITHSENQRLSEHQTWAEERARDIAERVGLNGEWKEMLAIAARLHDEGKRADRWQRAFNAPTGDDYAKTRGPLSLALLGGYRHEFTSLGVAENDDALKKLPADVQELALHLIAAHHGFARPVIRLDGCDDAPPSVLEKRVQEVALRFVRLQKQWGPWGLAWWESLLRAADQQASRAIEEPEVEEGKSDG